MRAWFNRLFRSRAETLAEKAEVEGRFEQAALLLVEGGEREEAVRVLLRAAEAARHLPERRAYLSRAHALARDPLQQSDVRRALAAVSLAEAEAAGIRTDEDRARLTEAAHALEGSGAFREAVRAWRLLGQKDGLERALMLSGDVEGYERLAGADADEERFRLRRRNAIESFESSWRSGDRRAALETLERWLASNPEDTEARGLWDNRRNDLTGNGRVEIKLDGRAMVLLGRWPVTIGREGDVPLRGAGVSREHCAIESAGSGAPRLVDRGSRNGTRLNGVVIAAPMPLNDGDRVALGPDLELIARTEGGVLALEVDRGMDRGRVAVLVAGGRWRCPFGTVSFDPQGGAVLEPDETVRLDGQRVAVRFTLARGDRIERTGNTLEVIG